ncbi:MAG: response regulator transcription factor, partial [Acidobacteriota bacterium]
TPYPPPPPIPALDRAGRRPPDADDDVPILMLTARDTLDDKLAGFDVGADDYLVKPFALQELLARLEAITQRGRAARRVLRFADVELDLGARVARRQGQRLRLNPAGLRLLQTLMEAAPDVVERQRLAEVVWRDAPPDSDALRTHVYQLRQALDRPFDRPLLETVHAVGYRLVAPAVARSAAS